MIKVDIGVKYHDMVIQSCLSFMDMFHGRFFDKEFKLKSG